MSKSILETEIYDQPAAVQRLLDEETASVREMVTRLRGAFHYVVIAARGTSDNAARYAQYLFGAHNQLPVALATPSLFSIYQSPPVLKDALVIGISQSGKSPDIVSVLAEAKRQGQPTLAITNEPQSALAEIADCVIPLHAGPEQATAATKTYTTSLAALALFSTLLAGNQEQLSDLLKAPVWMKETLSGLDASLSHVERYRYINRCAVIGRGFNYSTAFEVSLKVTELTRVVAEPYSSADFRHGPIAMVRDGFPVIVVALKGVVLDDLVDLTHSLKEMDSELLMISNDPGLLQQANLPLPIPAGIPEWLTPLAAVLPGQLFGYRLTMEKGFNPDFPEGITKVTETY